MDTAAGVKAQRNTKTKGVLVVEDQDLIAQMFETMIASSGAYHLCGRVRNADLAPVWCLKGGIDLILMDVYTELGASGLEAAAMIKEEFPRIKIIVVTSMPEVSFLRRAREAGVESFWYKEGARASILDVMNRTMAGESVYPDRTPRIRFGEIFSDDLTERELDVLREIVRGSTNAEIAESLCLSAATVKSYVNEIMSKTGFRTRTGLAVKARELGIVIAEG
ncbi:MAG: response regulator transcription factor [Lachnospiraceae bacterium]|nr:response regulator transcription factor [Lachnospiraceae bacterium]